MLFVFLTAFLQVFDELCETLFVMEATGNLPNPSLTGAFSWRRDMHITFIRSFCLSVCLSITQIQERPAAVTRDQTDR